MGAFPYCVGMLLSADASIMYEIGAVVICFSLSMSRDVTAIFL